jgi:uncharacterized membrane protein
MSGLPPSWSAPDEAPPAAPPDPSASTTVVHFYRAVVGHADVWRQRMDATTNWAAATTAAMITITFGAASPHFVLLLALAFNWVYLLMEARRYQAYHLWRHRFHTLNRYLIAPALAPHAAPEAVVLRRELQELALDLGRTLPRLRLREAMGFRIYRNYGYLFGIVLAAWILKLSVHPASATHALDLLDRARVGPLAGPVVWALVLAFFVALAWLAVRAPSEGMVDWTPHPSLWDRWRHRRADRVEPSSRSSAPPEADS